MIKKCIFLTLILSLSVCSFGQVKQNLKPVDFVNPLIGSHDSRWNLFPGPTLPFGMVKLSPDKQENGWKAGYEYNLHNIAGFSHIHSWTMAGLLTMPTTGPLMTEPGTERHPEKGYRSNFRHETETASPGYYSVFLDDYGIKAELTTTMRTGFQRYTFTKTDSARILVDMKIPSEYDFEIFWTDDADAVNSLDPFDVIAWFLLRGDKCLNKNTLIRRLLVRTGPLLFRINK